MASLLKSTKYICRVSSVLNRDSKQFGKQHLFDGCDETCWNSDQIIFGDFLFISTECRKIVCPYKRDRAFSQKANIVASQVIEPLQTFRLGFLQTKNSGRTGTPQWILIELEEAISIATFSFQFQGGFAGRDCEVEGGIDRASMEVIEAFYPEDNNTLQSFKLSRPLKVKCIRFNFKSSTDFLDELLCIDWKLIL